MLAGWSENSTAANAQYTPGDTLVMNGNVNLYAVWQKKTEGAAGDGENGVSLGKAGPKSGHGSNPGVASEGKTSADFGGGQNPSIAGGVTTVPYPGMAGSVSGAELMAAGGLTEIDVEPGGLSDANNPGVVYEVSPGSVPLKLPEPKDGTMPVAVGLLGGAFAVGGLYSFTSLSAKSLWLLRRMFFIK
jgi:hypothetical protein